MSRLISPAAVALIKEYEALRLTAYLCPAGVWTVGWGHTGPEVVEGYKITRGHAEIALQGDIDEAGRRILARIGAVIEDLNPDQLGALTSFVFNLGANPSWTIWKKLKARDFEAVPAQLRRFVYAGGKKLKGLERRREAEARLWQESGSVIPEPEDEPSTAALRTVISTPPEPAADAKPLSKSKTVWTAAAVTATGAIEASKQVQGLVAGQAGGNPLLDALNNNLGLIIVGLGVLILVIRYLDEKAKRR